VSATGGTLGTLVRKFVDAFVVRPADPALLISFAEGKAHLGEQSTLQDEEIRAYLEVATEIVESILGKTLSVRTFTERVRGYTDWSLRLRQTPIVSVTSITSIRTPTTTYGPSQLDVDTEWGYVTLLNQGYFVNGPWTAIYKAGMTNVPARYVGPVKDLLWHMWVFQRGQTADSITPELADVADFETRGSFLSGFLVPHYVMEKLKVGSDDVPGVA
jgi:hypothetical protein